jgi:hypothetical protein
VIRTDWETKGLIATLNSYTRKGIKYAVSMAMTWTARDASQAFGQELKSKLDRPTPLTQRASRFRPATKDRTEYDVFVQDEASKGIPPSRYLRALILGGYRANKRSETLLRSKGILPPGFQVEPGADAPLDRYGNLRGGGGLYVQILSGIKAFQERGHMMNRTERSQNLPRKRPLGDFFVLYSLKTKTPTGVYTRKGKRVLQILAFTPKRAKYAKTLNFKETIGKVFKEKFPGYLKEGLRRMIAKASQW